MFSCPNKIELPHDGSGNRNTSQSACSEHDLGIISGICTFNMNDDVLDSPNFYCRNFSRGEQAF